MSWGLWCHIAWAATCFARTANVKRKINRKDVDVLSDGTIHVQVGHANRLLCPKIHFLNSFCLLKSSGLDYCSRFISNTTYWWIFFSRIVDQSQPVERSEHSRASSPTQCQSQQDFYHRDHFASRKLRVFKVLAFFEYFS